MGERQGIPAVLHRHVRRSRQYMAISVHGVRKRRRRLPDTIHYCPDRRGKAVLPAGDDPGAILQPVSREDLGPRAGIQRCVCIRCPRSS